MEDKEENGYSIYIVEDIISTMYITKNVDLIDNIQSLNVGIVPLRGRVLNIVNPLSLLTPGAPDPLLEFKVLMDYI